MSLNIDLSPDLERRLEEEAARRGQAASDYARDVLEEKLAAAAPQPQLLPDGLPPSPLEDLVELARRQGVKPVEDPTQLLGDWSDDAGEDDTDVDAFLAGRQEWKWSARFQPPTASDPEYPAARPPGS